MFVVVHLSMCFYDTKSNLRFCSKSEVGICLTFLNNCHEWEKYRGDLSVLKFSGYQGKVIFNLCTDSSQV